MKSVNCNCKDCNCNGNFSRAGVYVFSKDVYLIRKRQVTSLTITILTINFSDFSIGCETYILILSLSIYIYLYR